MSRPRPPFADKLIGSGRPRARAVTAHEQRLLLMIAHELRNPLGAAETQVAVLRRYLTEEWQRQQELAAPRAQPWQGAWRSPDSASPRRSLPDAIHAAGLADRSLKRVRRQLDSIFDSARLLSGQLLFELNCEVRLQPVLDVILEELFVLYGARKVEVDLPPTLAPLCGERAQIEQLLTCPLYNACQYTEHRVPIGLRARPLTIDAASTARRLPSLRQLAAGPYVYLEIWDRGGGIPPTEWQRVFAPFYRLAPPGSGGLGLGLYICAAVVRSHGGAAWIDDRRCVGGAAPSPSSLGATEKVGTVVHVVWPAGKRARVPPHGRRPPRP